MQHSNRCTMKSSVGILDVLFLMAAIVITFIADKMKHFGGRFFCIKFSRVFLHHIIRDEERPTWGKSGLAVESDHSCPLTDHKNSLSQAQHGTI